MVPVQSGQHVAAHGAQRGRERVGFHDVEQGSEFVQQVALRTAHFVGEFHAEHAHAVRLRGVGHRFETEVQQVDPRRFGLRLFGGYSVRLYSEKDRGRRLEKSAFYADRRAAQ